jgi:hypothetical protein
MSVIKEHLESIISITSGKQKDFYLYFLENGEYFGENIPRQDMAYLSIRKSAISSAQARNCFSNAKMYAITDDRFDYIEGFYVTKTVPTMF